MRKGSKKPSAGVVPKHRSKVKQPMAVSTPEAERLPRVLHVEYDNILERHPVWRFGEIDADWPSAAPNLTAKQFRDLHTCLGEYETQQLSEIWKPGGNCHKYSTGELPGEAFRRLRDIERDDETEVCSLRVNGRYRVHGILRKHIFYVLWIDPEHEVWPSKKKHT